MKRAAAEAALRLVQDGMIVGLGSGSTSVEFVRSLGERVAEGLSITAVASSRRTATLATKLHIPLVRMEGRVDIAVDGADAVDSTTLGAIKGLGGALTRERIVAEHADLFALIVDETKIVPNLADSFDYLPIPIAVIPFGWEATKQSLTDLGNPRLRLGDDGTPYATDNGNYILDLYDVGPGCVSKIGCQIKTLPGVVEHGLFLNIASVAFVGGQDGVIELQRGNAMTPN